jgi:hypothetical protein
MKPVQKFYFYVVTATLMFEGLRLVMPRLPEGGVPAAIAGGIATALGSWGLYRVLHAVVAALLEKWDWLLKFVLGAEYVNGTWVGFVLTKTGKPRLVVEKYEQSLYHLLIRGWSFLPNGDPEASWTTNSAQVVLPDGKLCVLLRQRSVSKQSGGSARLHAV